MQLDPKDVARALGGEAKSGQVLAPGPGHSPVDRSLSVRIDPAAPDGFIVHSFSNDDAIACKDYVRSKLGLPTFESGANSNYRARRSEDAVAKAMASAIAAPITERPKGVVVATYHYTDERGELLYQVLRYEPKTFRQRRPDGRGPWIHDAGDRKVLYRWPELIQFPDATVFVCEGEKDADRIASLGHCATAVAAGKWTRECVEALKDRDVLILEDNDETGRKKSLEAATTLHGTAKTIRIVRLPDLPEKGDVSDWLDADPRRADRLVDISFDAPLWQPDGGTTNASEQATITVPNVTDFKPWWRSAVAIPRREFLYSRHYARRNIGASIGGGGRGKTTLGTFEGVSMAVGCDLATGAPLPSGPLRVWILNGEEDQDELDRRLAAICLRCRVTEADLGGRLFAKSVRDKPIRIATLHKNAPILNEAAVKLMTDFIEQNQIDVFMVDPLISFHAVVENDNSHMDLVIKEGFGAIANKTNSAGEVFHHPGKPKPGQAETVVEDARGASAVIWAVRAARVLNFMTLEEAAKLGITEEERRLHIRILNGKANMGPLGKANWMKLLIENLPNGDQVAVASSWSPPDPFEGLSTADMELARKLAETGEYRADTRSPKWIGYALASHFGMKVSYSADNDPKDFAKLQAILKTWLKNKVLVVEERKDGEGKERKFVMPGSFVPEPQTANLDDD
jgi:AAA domain